jgi:hypothetical protein
MGDVNGTPGAGPDPIDEEFEFHLAACAAELERRGLSPGEARAEAERRFGHQGVHQRACRREAPEERMGRVLQVAMVATIVALAGTTATLGFVAWRQSRELVELARKDAAAPATLVAVPAVDPVAGWASVEDGSGRIHRFVLQTDAYLTANGLVRGYGAGQDGKPFRITVVPTTPRAGRLTPWKLSGKAVVLVDGLEAVTYVRDPRAPRSECDFPVMSGDRIIVSPERAGPGVRPTAMQLPTYTIAGEVRNPAQFNGEVDVDLAQLVTLAGGYTGPAGSTVEVRIVPRVRAAERARQWAQGGGQVVESPTGPTIIHRGDLRQNAFWQNNIFFKKHARGFFFKNMMSIARY